MNNSSLYRHAAKVGILALVLYAVCLVWRPLLGITNPQMVELHLQLLQMALPGWRGFELASLLWGACLSFVYGFLASLLFHALHRNCCEGK